MSEKNSSDVKKNMQVVKQIPLIDCDPNFVHIFRYMFREKEVKRLGPHAFTVYVCIKTYSNIRTGSAWPGINKIVEETGISRRKVISSIQELCDAGYLKKEEASGKVNKYQIVEKIPFESSEGENKGEITFDYSPTLLTSAVSEIKNFAMTGDAKDAKVIKINTLTINVIQQRDNGKVIVNSDDGDIRQLRDKIKALPEESAVRKAFEAYERNKATES